MIHLHDRNNAWCHRSKKGARINLGSGKAKMIRFLIHPGNL